jgi:hypothetical protein
MRFEIYEPFVSLTFWFFFSGRSKPRITATTDTESVDMRAGLYNLYCFRFVSSVHRPHDDSGLKIFSHIYLNQRQLY